MKTLLLKDVRDWVETLGISENVYSGKLPDHTDKAIGVYNSKHTQKYKAAYGGESCESYGIKQLTFLVHWSRDQIATEEVACQLMDAVRNAREVHMNDAIIKFFQPLYETQDVGTDDNGIYEMVIEAAAIYSKEE